MKPGKMDLDKMDFDTRIQTLVKDKATNVTEDQEESKEQEVKVTEGETPKEEEEEEHKEHKEHKESKEQEHVKEFKDQEHKEFKDQEQEEVDEKSAPATSYEVQPSDVSEEVGDSELEENIDATEEAKVESVLHAAKKKDEKVINSQQEKAAESKESKLEESMEMDEDSIEAEVACAMETESAMTIDAKGSVSEAGHAAQEDIVLEVAEGPADEKAKKVGPGQEVGCHHAEERVEEVMPEGTTGKKAITENADMNMNQPEPVVETSPENITVKVEVMENGEYVEEDYITKYELNVVHDMFDVKPKIESDLEVQPRNDERRRVINNIKAKDEKYRKMKVDLQLAKEREKELMEELGSKDKEIQELKRWKKEAESKSQEGEKQVEQHTVVEAEKEDTQARPIPEEED